MRILLFIVLAIVSTGCAVSDTTRYYALVSSPTPDVAPRPAAESGPTIGVGPVVVPGYLDRPHVVTRDASDGLEIWSYHRWAEPLDLGIAQALAEALAASVPADRIAVYPWRGALTRILDYQVAVSVARFEGSRAHGVTLDARWRLLSRDGKELAFKRTTLTEPVPGDGFPALVAAMNRSISRLAQDIGEAIRSQAANSAAIRE
jgi:uncharacterized lipoprotein YmbA